MLPKLGYALFDADYTSSRWTYGFQNRPPGYAHNPPGFIINSDRPHNDFRWGTVDYPRPLTEKECSSYELTFIGVKLTPSCVDDYVICPNENCWSDGSSLFIQYGDRKELWVLGLKANAEKLYSLKPLAIFNQDLRLQ